MDLEEQAKRERKREREERGLKEESEEDEDEDDEEESDDDDSEEEESDEEDDDDDEEAPAASGKGKKRPAKRQRNIFIDEAAEEDDEYEDEEYDEEGYARQNESLDPEMKRRYDRRTAPIMEKSAEELARMFQNKASQIREREDRQQKASGLSTVETARSVRERPSASDPKLFLVACGRGKEKELVLRLYQKYIYDMFKRPETNAPQFKSKFTVPTAPGAEKEIFSVVAPGTPGYIYVEAFKEENVRAAIRGVSGLFSSKVSIIPPEEMPDVLRVDLKKDVTRVNDYVRLKGPFPYKDDLAKVAFIESGGNKLVVRVVPRINFAELAAAMDESSGATKKPQQKIIPPSKYFNADEVRTAGGVIERERFDRNGETLDKLGDHFFENGLMYLEVSERLVRAGKIDASLDEIERLNNPGAKSSAGSSSSSSAIGTSAEDNVQRMKEMAEIVSKTASKSTAAHQYFNSGDRVMVIEGQQKNATGVLDGMNTSKKTGMVRVEGADNLKIEVNLADLVKMFADGDKVAVTTGPHSGRTGVVVKTLQDARNNRKPSVICILDLGGEEVELFNDMIKISNQLSAGLQSLNGYQMLDLVLLDQGIHGIIIRINQETVRVLTQSSEIKDISTSAIRQNKSRESKRAESKDSQGNALHVGDLVTVTSGQFQTLEGAITQMHPPLLFVHCKEREHENAGIIVVQAKHVRLSGAKRTMGGGMPPPNLVGSMGPPALGGGGRGGPGGGGGGGGGMMHGRRRDELLGKTVKVRKGSDKGLTGVVLEGGSDTHIRLELNARNKIITILRENVMLVGEDQQGGGDAFGGSGGFGGSVMSAPMSSSHHHHPHLHHAHAHSAYSMTASATPASLIAPSTPLHSSSDVVATPAPSSVGAQVQAFAFKQGDSVKLVGTGETVTISKIIGQKDMVVKTSSNSYKLVQASDVMWA